MNSIQIFGAFLIIVIIGLVGFLSGKAVSNVSDYTTAGGKGNSLMVVGIALATLIGGATTVGTTQTAFNFGIASMWYTLGSAVAFLIVAFILVPIIREKKQLTLGGIISQEFGTTSELIASSILFLSMAISLASQMVSSSAVLKSMIPNINSYLSLILCFLLTVICVFTGGSLSAGKAGQLKTLLIVLTVIGCGIYIICQKDFSSNMVCLSELNYFNIFSRGTGYELGNGIATALGVCCSQANLHAVLAAKDDKIAKKGMIICSVLMPIIGLGSSAIGLFMRINNPDVSSASAFSHYLVNYLPNMASGIAVGTLFITLILSAAGTALGCSTVLIKSILKKTAKKAITKDNELIYLRGSMLITLILATLAGSGIFGDSVLSFAFLSMSLRCVTLIVPFILAVFFQGKTNRTWVIIGEVIAPLAVIIFGLFNIVKIDELYIGLIISAICGIIAFIKGGNSKNYSAK